MPASLITLAGLILSIWGALWIERPIGLLLILIGRAMDLIDGPLSRATRPTRFGAGFDATADKIALVAILAASFFNASVPLLVLAYVTTHNIINAIMAGAAQLRGYDPVTSLDGKLAMFFENAALFAFIFASYGSGHHVFYAIGWASIVLSVPLGMLATAKYGLTAIGRGNK